MASGIFVFDEIFGVRFFKKQEFCHFEQSLGILALFFGDFWGICHFELSQKAKNPHFKFMDTSLRSV